MRPVIVKGDSVTDAITKFDGLYFMLNILDQLDFLPVIPYFGVGSTEGNFVPAYYVLQATSYFVIVEIGIGKTPRGTLPITVVKSSLSGSGVRKWLQLEKGGLYYFNIHSAYDCAQTVVDLENIGIICPDLKDTVLPMIDLIFTASINIIKQNISKFLKRNPPSGGVSFL